MDQRVILRHDLYEGRASTLNTISLINP